MRSINNTSAKNKIVVTPTFFDPSHTIYIILNEDINISSGVGIPVNGIMGFGFFKDYPMEIDYVNHYITVYKHKSKAVIKKYKKFKKYLKNLCRGKKSVNRFSIICRPASVTSFLLSLLLNNFTPLSNSQVRTKYFVNGLRGLCSNKYNLPPDFNTRNISFNSLCCVVMLT